MFRQEHRVIVLRGQVSFLQTPSSVGARLARESDFKSAKFPPSLIPLIFINFLVHTKIKKLVQNTKELTTSTG
jgi:hypothetical protein